MSYEEVIDPADCDHDGSWMIEPDEDYEDESVSHSYRCGECDCEISVMYQELDDIKTTKNEDGHTVTTQNFRKTITYYDGDE